MSIESFRDTSLRDDEHHRLALELCRVHAQLAEMHRLAAHYGLMALLNPRDYKVYSDGVLREKCQALTESARLSAIVKAGYVGMIEQDEL